MAQCITCGSELHPERAEKYNYCMAPECQEKNLKGLTMVAIGVNKAAEAYMLLDEKTKDELASGRFADQRRGSFGTSLPSAVPETGPALATGTTAAQAGGTSTRPRGAQPERQRQSRRRPAAPAAARRPWTKSQERLALLYNEQGLRPEEIASKLGLGTYAVTQIILGSKNRGKL